jgi:hypothetical protein
VKKKHYEEQNNKQLLWKEMYHGKQSSNVLIPKISIRKTLQQMAAVKSPHKKNHTPTACITSKI